MKASDFNKILVLLPIVDCQGVTRKSRLPLAPIDAANLMPLLGERKGYAAVSCYRRLLDQPDEVEVGRLRRAAFSHIIGC